MIQPDPLSKTRLGLRKHCMHAVIDMLCRVSERPSVWLSSVYPINSIDIQSYNEIGQAMHLSNKTKKVHSLFV